MAYIKNFETEAHKHSRMQFAPKSEYEAWDNPTVKVRKMVNRIF